MTTETLSTLSETVALLAVLAAISAEAKGSDDACWCGQNGAALRYRHFRAAGRLLPALRGVLLAVEKLRDERAYRDLFSSESDVWADADADVKQVEQIILNALLTKGDQ